MPSPYLLERYAAAVTFDDFLCDGKSDRCRQLHANGLCPPCRIAQTVCKVLLRDSYTGILNLNIDIIFFSPGLYSNLSSSGVYFMAFERMFVRTCSIRSLCIYIRQVSQKLHSHCVVMFYRIHIHCPVYPLNEFGSLCSVYPEVVTSIIKP